MTVPNQFANVTTSIPLSQLDANFNTPITLGNTAIQLGNTVTTLNNMTLANVTISSGNVTITNVSVTTANVTTANITTAIIGTANVTTANVTTGIIGTANVTTGNITTAVITTANVATANITTSQILNYGTANSVVYLNSSKAATADTGLQFDGTNLGLGVTPSAWGTFKAFQVGYTNIGGFTSGNNAFLSSNAYYSGSGWIYQGSYAATYYQQLSGQHIFYTAPSGTAGNAITFTQAMTLDASSNFYIGTTSPTTFSGFRTFEYVNSGGNAIHLVTGTGVIAQTISNNGVGAVYMGARSNHPLVFTTNDTERARITSGGEVYIAGTTDQGAYNLQCNGTGVWGAGAYVNGSDERIKEDIAPIASGLDVVTKLNPVTYRYKEDWSKDQSTQTGFIAQELLVAMEGQNYVDGVVQQGGSEGYYSVAYQNIIPLLTKAIQELKAELDATKAKVAALENA